MSMFDKRKENEPLTPPKSPESPVHGSQTAERRIPEPTARGVAMIGKTISIKGDITGEESLVIEGRVDGTIALKNNDLTIGQSGVVNANLTASVVRIDGEVKGDIVGVEKVVISKTGKVHGNIVGPRVTLEDGAKFKGSIDMDPGSAESVLAPQAPKSISGSKPAAMENKTAEISGKS